MSKASSKSTTKSDTSELTSLTQGTSVGELRENTRKSASATKKLVPSPASSGEDSTNDFTSRQPTDENNLFKDDAVADVMVESDSEADCSVDCSGHDHLEKEILDEVFQFPVDTLYKMIFTNHPFSKKFLTANKCSGLELSEWSEPDPEGESTRIKKYNITYQNMGTKSAVTTEKQANIILSRHIHPAIRRRYSQPGLCYVIDAEARTAGIPYADSFYLLNRFCLTRCTRYTTRLRITSSVIFTKKVWAMIKGFIEKNVDTGTISSYSLMARMLHEDAKSIIRRRKSGIRRGRRVKTKQRSVQHKHREQQADAEEDNGRKNHGKKRKANTAMMELTSRHGSIFNSTVLSRVMLVMFVFLMLLNVVLYSKLVVLQEKANILSKHKEDIFNVARSIHSADEWQSLYDSQQQRQEAESRAWNELLKVSARILETMHKTLRNITTEVQQS